MNLIFDFDGTLVDSFKCLIEKSNLLADEFNFRKIKEDEIPKLKELSSTEIIQFLEIPFYLIPKLILNVRKHMRDEMKNLKPIAGVKEMIVSLAEQGFNMGILTSNSEENVSIWLAQNQLQSHFKFISTESNLFSKSAGLKNVIKEYQFDKTKTFYICDETRDIEAASECYIQSVAVTWGYHSEDNLKRCAPSFIIQKPEEILGLFKAT